MAGTRTAALVLLTVATGVCLGACGASTAGGAAASPLTGTVLRLGPADSGRTVTLAVGDRLVVTLSGGRLAGSWALSSYPRGALRTDLRSVPLGGAALVAQAAGAGQVVLVRPLCGPVADPPCPAGSGVGPAPVAPTRWAVAVVVR